MGFVYMLLSYIILHYIIVNKDVIQSTAVSV